MENFHSKIFKRDNGSKVKIEVNIYFILFDGNKMVYEFAVFTKSKGEIEWAHVKPYADDMINDEVLKVVSRDEILEVQTEFWDNIEPELSGLHNT